MIQTLKKLAREDSGQDLIEYAMVAAIIVLGSLAVMRSMTISLKGLFSGISTALSNA